MALKTGEKKIGEIAFVVTQLGALEGSKTLLRLTKAVGPAIGTVAKAVMAGAAMEKITGQPVDKSEILTTVLGSLQSLPENDFEILVKTFAASTKVQRPFTADGRTVLTKLTDCLDEVLGGDYMTLLAWLVFAVEVNYTDFFVGAIRTMSKDEPPAEEAK